MWINIINCNEILSQLGPEAVMSTTRDELHCSCHCQDAPMPPLNSKDVPQIGSVADPSAHPGSLSHES